MPRQCFLKCLLDSHTPIHLEHNEEVVIGRSKQTKIKDQSCSRKQISLKADCKECHVEVKQLGVNPSGLDGFALKKNEVYKVQHGTKIEVVLNNFMHVIEFSPPPDSHKQIKNNSKRKLDKGDSPNTKKMFKKNSKDLPTSIAAADVWEEVDVGHLFIFTAKWVRPSEKIAAFDMDGTLITTKSGKVFPVDTTDWKIIFSCVTSKLKHLFENGFKIVILSNQGLLGSGKVKKEDFKKKIEAVIEKLDVPIQAYFATGKDKYRKPLTGMWETLAEQKNDSIPINMEKSFYCGDAAGRVANWAPGKKKDHSLVDKLLAKNLGLSFYTPEQFFLGESIDNITFSPPEFNPLVVKPEPFNDDLISNEKEILVLVGYPGSGKSFLAKQIELKSRCRYISVCRDVLGTWQKCASEAKTLLKQQISVIVDSTNPDIESRKRWVALAKDLNVSCRCVRMTASRAHSQHNNKFRELMKIKHVPVNDIVFYTYRNKFVEPTLNEGFKEIIKVNFNPVFENQETEKFYKMHLLER